MGCGILLTYPQIAAYSGIHGLFVYALCGAIPLVIFAVLGPIIRKKTPHGFVMTEWVRQRYGVGASWLVSCATILTVYLFMVSELTSIQAVIESLTNLKGWPALIVEACVTGIYTSLGGFQTSFFTDNLQAPAVLALLIIVIAAMGAEIKIDKSLVGPSGLLKGNLLGWKLIYILFVAIMTNDCFMAGFWLRTFASKTNRDLYIACTIAGFLFFIICAGVGIPGMLAVWAKIIDPASPTFEEDSMVAFFLVLKELPKWVHGFTLVFACLLSSCTIDSFQSALASTVSNDFFRNRVRKIWVRAFTLATLAPSIVVALQAPNVLNIYLICDVLSSAIIPVLFLGLSKYFWFVTGLEIFMSLIGGIIGVFVFGTIFWHSASGGGAQLIMSNGIYGDDWSAFGTFVVAPLASIVGAMLSILARGIWLACSTKRLWAVFDEPTAATTAWGRFWFGHDDVLVKHHTIPWYERYNMPAWCKTVDYWIFIQDYELAEKPHEGSDESDSVVTTSEKESSVKNEAIIIS